MPCDEFVELVSAFLDDALEAETRQRFLDHLPTCPGCERYLDQFRRTIDAIGYLPTEKVPDEARVALMAVFRNTD